MKASYLFPSYFRPIGFALAIPGLILGSMHLFYGYVIPGFGTSVGVAQHSVTGRIDNYTNELALILTIVGFAFIAFSKLKKDDELTAQLRLNALYWARLVNVWYMIPIIIDYVLSGHSVDSIVLDYNLFMPLVIFLGRFYYLLHRSRNVYYIKPLRLLPYKPFNVIAKILAIPCIIGFIFCAIYATFFGRLFEKNPIWYQYSDAIFYITPIVLWVWIFSKQKVEDEYISSLRLHAMQIAIYANCAALLLANFTFYGFNFLTFKVLDLSIMPMIFVIIFQYRLSKQTEIKNDDTLNLSIL